MMIGYLKIAVCDDDALAIGIASGAVTGFFDKKNIPVDVSTFRTARELESAMRRDAFDLILLDINLPDANGIDFGVKLRNEGSKTQIVFVSSNENCVFDSFKCEPIGFVRKSKFLKDIIGCLELFLKKRDEFGSGAKTVSVKCKKQILLISVDTIVYIEGALKKQRISVVGSSEEYVASSSMKKLEEELSPYGFLRIHSGYLVNYRFIKLISNSEVILKDGKSLPVSRGQMKLLRERFLELKNKNGIISV